MYMHRAALLLLSGYFLSLKFPLTAVKHLNMQHKSLWDYFFFSWIDANYEVFLSITGDIYIWKALQFSPYDASVLIKQVRVKRSMPEKHRCISNAAGDTVHRKIASELQSHGWQSERGIFGKWLSHHTSIHLARCWVQNHSPLHTYPLILNLDWERTCHFLKFLFLIKQDFLTPERAGV